MIWWIHDFLHWLLSPFGVFNMNSPEYGFYSGIGSDISEVTIIPALIGFYLHKTCHVQHCLRLAHHAHTQDGVTYQLCRKHHPNTQGRLKASGIHAPEKTI